MILRRNIDEEPIIDLEYSNERNIISAFNIIDLAPNKTIDKKFTLIFKVITVYFNKFLKLFRIQMDLKKYVNLKQLELIIQKFVKL